MAKQLRTEHPDAIIVTLSGKFFEEYPGGEEKLGKDLMAYNDEHLEDGYLWHQSCGNIPTIEVGWCYICFKGFIQYRMTIVDFLRNTTVEFEDGRVLPVRNWARLAGPVEKAPYPIPRKGFQGFRYTKLLW